jgi:phosphate/sulfate permease
MRRALIDFVHEHGILVILFVLWALALVTWVVFVTFTKTPDIPGTTATLVGSIIGLPATAFGIWQWRVGKQKKEDEGQ